MVQKESYLLIRLKELVNSLGVFDPSVTPQEALQLIPKILSKARKNKTPARVELENFLVYVLYIVIKLPEAEVTGVWENILAEILKYSRNLSRQDIRPHNHISISQWLNNALRCSSKCPNPYVRLKLFHLARLFSLSRIRSCNTFMETICEVQPYHIYPKDTEESVSFTLSDFYDNMEVFLIGGRLQNKIKADITEQLKNTSRMSCINKGAKFLSHCIQLTGVYADIARINPDEEEKFNELMAIGRLFQDGIGILVNCEKLLPRMTPWQQFQYLTALPPFRPHIVETVQALTAAIDTFDSKRKARKCYSRKSTLMFMRDEITNGLAICLRESHLPKLVLSRQVQGCKSFHKHALLLMELDIEDD